ncbi:RING finger protein 145-like [Pyxicephalus adspersus]|uniref:RING-type domain-containing protein n=1 Tax=Pyxicephalus adspersus TaxID=30357 RepID=A0AAV3ADX5_PYXAD|nr:TPA: hypothetical protein GDO54_009729 [Pyxicephalus adspersus]
MLNLEDVANVALRVPPIVLLDLLYRWDVEEFKGEFSHPAYNTSSFYSYLLCNVYYLAHVVCTLLVILPLRHLVNIYLYLLTALLLYVAHQTVRDYIRWELDDGYLGTMYEDYTSLTRSVSTLTGLVMVCTLCSLLMRTRQAWLFSAPVLPLLARLAGVPLPSLPLFNTISTGATLLVMCYVALSGFRPLCRLFAMAYEQLTQNMELYRLVALGMALWTQLAVSAIFLVFWLVLYLLQVYSSLSSKPGILEQQGPVFILLNSVSECCGTPYCLLGLTFTVSYLALGVLNLCKFYLMGFAAFQNGNAMHRGVTEGVTLMLLSLQTGLLELQVLQRTFLLSIIFFIVVTSTLQSMIEIADPVVLALAATGNRRVWKHTRCLSLCLFLLFFPTFMAYKIAYIFHMDFWLLILVSSCLLTSLQVLGTLFLYALFMIEQLQDSQVERMDEIIYGVNAISRVLEFLVALCVVAYGTWESIFGEWSWMGVSVIIVHSYFNVWLRAQSGWKNFLLRREAAKKISHLPRATEEELRAHNDVCSICFQEMSIAVITVCNHFFHSDCLKKWLYVQDTCPLCHQLVRAMGRDEEEVEDSDENSDSDEKGAEEQGGIWPEGEDGVGPQEESVKKSQPGDHQVESQTFVGENHHVVEEATCQETKQETETVPNRKVEEGILEDPMHYLGLEDDHYRKEQEEEVLCKEAQEEVYEKEISCSKEYVLQTREQKEELHFSKEQTTEEFLHNKKENISFIEDQEVVPFWKPVQETEQDQYRLEEVPCKEEVRVLCRATEKVIDKISNKQAQKVDVSCREKKTVQTLNRKLEEVPYKKVQNEVIHCSQEKLCKTKQSVSGRKSIEVPYRGNEEVAGEDSYMKEQDAVPCRKQEQVLYKEVGEVEEENLYRKQVEEVPRMERGTGSLQE